MKKNVIYLAIMMIFVFAQTGLAQEAEKHGDCKGHGKMAGLNLTEEQQKKVDELKTAHLKETLQLKNQIKEKEAALNTLETAEKPDMGKINKTIEEIGAIKIEMQKKNAAHRQEVRKLLTEEQRLKFDMHHGRMGGQMHEKGNMGPKGEMGNHKMHNCK